MPLFFYHSTGCLGEKLNESFLEIVQHNIPLDLRTVKW